jgi:hypothetical protein
MFQKSKAAFKEVNCTEPSPSARVPWQYTFGLSVENNFVRQILAQNNIWPKQLRTQPLVRLVDSSFLIILRRPNGFR